MSNILLAFGVIAALLLLVLVAPSLVFGFGMVNMTQTTNMTTYKDPQNRFSVSYPTNTTATPATNRFETNLLDIKDTPGPTGGDSMSVILLRGSGTDPKLTANASASMDTSTLFQPVECTKYKVDGQKGCSFITATSAIFPGTSGRVVVEVDSYVGGICMR